MNTKLFAVTALAAFAAFSAHADDADPSQQFAAKVTSSATRADVQAQARTPWKITNGGTGYEGIAMSNAQRDDVRTQAATAVREGATSRGEMSFM
jgi:hypothetical protein